MHYAAENGHIEDLKSLLKYSDNTELEDGSYQRAANLAATRGHLTTVKLFISAVEKISGDSILEAASRAGHLLVVEYLLHNKLASPDGDRSLHSRPISLAASKGYNEVVRTLLRYNAAVDIEDATRQTPLHHAAENGRYQVAKTLLENGANVNALDSERNTPLHSAAKVGQVSVIELLETNGADVKACSRTNETPLHSAVKSPKAVEALLNAKADRTATDMLGQTPLHLAARGKCYESADLLRWAEDIDAQDDEKEDATVPCYSSERSHYGQTTLQRPTQLTRLSRSNASCSDVGCAILCARRARFLVKHIVRTSEQAGQIWLLDDPCGCPNGVAGDSSSPS